MKKLIPIIVIFLVILIPVILSGQNPPHPNGGVGPGGGNTPVGGGAPLGEGIILLLSLGIGYGVSKYRQIRKTA